MKRENPRKRSTTPKKTKIFDNSKFSTDPKATRPNKVTEEELLLITNSRNLLQKKPNFFIDKENQIKGPSFIYNVTNSPNSEESIDLKETSFEKKVQKSSDFLSQNVRVLGMGLEELDLKGIEHDVNAMCVKICQNDTVIDAQMQEVRSKFSALEQKEERLKNLAKNIFGSFASIEKTKAFIKETQVYLNYAEDYHGGITQGKKPLRERIVELEIENESLKKRLALFSEEFDDSNEEISEIRKLKQKNKELNEKNRAYEQAFGIQEEKIRHLEDRVKQLLSFLGKK